MNRGVTESVTSDADMPAARLSVKDPVVGVVVALAVLNDSVWCQLGASCIGVVRLEEENVSTKRHAATRRRQAQSRKTPGTVRSQGSSSHITVTVPAAPTRARPVPVVTRQPLLPSLPTAESFARSASEELRMNLSARADEEIDNLAEDANDVEDTADEWGGLYDEAVPSYKDQQSPDAHAWEEQRHQTPYEAAAERIAYVVTPLITGFRAYAPAWREFFRRSERNWRQRNWYRELRLLPRLIAVLLFVAVASTFAVVIATKAAAFSPSALATANATSTLPGGIVLQQSPSEGTAIVPPADYLVGIWTSDASPPTSGSVQVYVRLTHTSQALPNVPVSITVNFPGFTQSYGPVKTDSYGLATFTVNYSGAPSAHPVYMTATAIINGQKVAQQAYFVPH